MARSHGACGHPSNHTLYERDLHLKCTDPSSVLQTRPSRGILRISRNSSRKMTPDKALAGDILPMQGQALRVGKHRLNAPKSLATPYERNLLYAHDRRYRAELCICEGLASIGIIRAVEEEAELGKMIDILLYSRTAYLSLDRYAPSYLLPELPQP